MLNFVGMANFTKIQQQLKETPAFRGVTGFLSNFSPYKEDEMYEFDGIKYPTNEHFYQAQKFASEYRQQIADHPSKGLKKFCRTLPSFRTELWLDARVDVMLLGLKYKFSLPRYKELLLLTGNEELVERNWWKDTFWGVCNGVGENRLGKMLMEIRNKLRNEN